MVTKFSGSGGAGSNSPTETNDNLFSTDIVEVILGVSEGPIKGLKDGPKSFLLGETPLKNVNGQNNFDSFELAVRKGSDLGEVIVSRLGGFASSTNVTTELASGVPVVRQATHTGIDYIDIRLVINRLMRQTDDGSFNNTGKVKVEYKKTSSPTWLPVTTINTSPPLSQQLSSSTDIYTEIDSTHQAVGSPGDRIVFVQNDAPSVTGQSVSMWFDSNDAYKPYRVVGSSWVQIPGSTYSSGVWTWTEISAWNTPVQVHFYIAATAPSLKNQGDYWFNTTNSKAYFFNGSAWIVAGSSLKPGNFGSGSVSLANGEVSVTGKTTTSFVREFRFQIANIDDDTYQLRVTKTSPDNTSQNFFDVTWESFQEVTASPMQFPGLATVQLTARASEQFSSIPQFSGIYEGRVIRVPTNYNPVTRIYTGIWDGAWKLAYSNNPAYVVYDLVSNDRYGLNAYYPVVLNKWDVYEAGVWCDTRTVEDIPRFTFNELIDTARSCREAIDYICGIFGGRFFDDGNGSANIRIDKPENAAGIFAPENIVDGIFSYSFTEITSRYNDITVTFTNPALGYKEDRRRIFNQDHIDKYGRIPLNFIAVGCNSSAEAIVRGRYKLITGLAETAIINFKTNRQGLYYVPYDIILIADEDMNAGQSGRVKAITGANTFTLRDPITLEAGFNYKILFQIPDGLDVNNFIVLERELTPGISGTFSSFTTLTELPALSDQAMFSISTTNDHAAPRPFRITRIDEVDGDPDKVEIQAIEVNRLKWDFVDGIITDYEDPEHYDLETGGRTQAVPALRIRAFNTLSGSRTVNNIVLDWDPSPTKTTSSYKVYMSKDNGPQALLAETGIYSFEWNDIAPGEYLFSVVAISTVNNSLSESIPVTIEHRFVGDYRDPDRITDLHMIDEAAPPIFARRSPSFAWTAIENPDHTDYVIRIYDPSSGIVLAQHYTRETNYVYDYQTNRADHAMVAVRDFDIGVASRDQFGGISAFNVISATNPPPGATVPTVAPLVGSAVITWDTTGITDYLSTKIWVSETSGFTPDPSNLVYEGGGGTFTFAGVPDSAYYMRLAILDDFNQTEYNSSIEIVLPIGGIDFASLTQNIRDQLGLLTGYGPGSVRSLISDVLIRIDELASTALTDQTTHKSTLTLLEAHSQNAAAAIVEERIARVSDTEAFASALLQTTAEFENDISDLEASLGGIISNSLASGFIQLTVNASSVEAKATVIAKVRAQAGGAFSEAAWQISAEVVDGEVISSFGVFADRFFVTDGLNQYNPMLFTGGVLTLEKMRFRELRSTDGSTIVINGDTGDFSFGAP